MKRVADSLPALPDIESRLAATETAGLPTLKLAVLRNITIEPIEPYLCFRALNMGMNAEVRFGGLDNYMQEALDTDSDLLNDDLDAALVFTPLPVLSPNLSDMFDGLSEAEIEGEIDHIGGVIKSVVKGIRAQTRSMILWHAFEPLLYPVAGQAGIVARLNDMLARTLAEVANAYAIDMGACLSRLGAENFYDLRYWHLAMAPYTTDALAEISGEIFKHLRAVKGQIRKCLVLDCDDTLWGGIVGEDGLAGIRLGAGYPGSAFQAFQRQILSLQRRGVILAVCSKNNERDVWEVFDSHPDMILKREHISAHRINWSDKAANLRELAQELNIGLDSLVFCDDSAFEATLVRSILPEVAVLHMPADRPAEYRWILAACGLFDLPVRTEEDRMRGAMYNAERQRRQVNADATNLDSYLRSLEIRLQIGRADQLSIPRIAQQTQKTNQFNLTTRRYTELDIARFTEADDYDVVWCRVADKFGDMGIIGSCVVKYLDGDAEIDTLLMSCRSLGRKIENRFLAEVVELAKERGAKRVVGQFIATAKNGQVEDFFPRCGFHPLDPASGAGVRYAVDVEDFKPDAADWFVSVDRSVGSRSARDG